MKPYTSVILVFVVLGGIPQIPLISCQPVDSYLQDMLRAFGIQSSFSNYPTQDYYEYYYDEGPTAFEDPIIYEEEIIVVPVQTQPQFEETAFGGIGFPGPLVQPQEEIIIQDYGNANPFISAITGDYLTGSYFGNSGFGSGTFWGGLFSGLSGTATSASSNGTSNTSGTSANSTSVSENSTSGAANSTSSTQNNSASGTGTAYSQGFSSIGGGL